MLARCAAPAVLRRNCLRFCCMACLLEFFQNSLFEDAFCPPNDFAFISPDLLRIEIRAFRRKPHFICRSSSSSSSAGLDGIIERPLFPNIGLRTGAGYGTFSPLML